MSFHYITARLIENRVDVATPGSRYAVFRHDDAKGNGSCPMDYLAGALGSWINLTLAAVAAKKEIRMESLETQVRLGSSENDEKARAFLIVVDIAGQLTDRECKILSNTAKICEIGKMLNDNVDIRYQINFHT